jgi:hypothetical protein
MVWPLKAMLLDCAHRQSFWDCLAIIWGTGRPAVDLSAYEERLFAEREKAYANQGLFRS